MIFINILDVTCVSQRNETMGNKYIPSAHFLNEYYFSLVEEMEGGQN